MKKLTLIFTTLVTTTVLLSGCIKPDTPQDINSQSDTTPSPETTVEASPSLTQQIHLEATQAGQTAFDLLQASHQVELKEYDFGVFIESIDSIPGNDQYYWAFYVNDQYAQQGADQTTLETGDQVIFKYEPVQAAF